MRRVIGLYTTGSTSIPRAIFAFLLVPLLSSILVVSVVVLSLVLRIPPDETGTDLFRVVVGSTFLILYGVVAFGAPLTYLGTLLVGFPAWVLLRYTANESGFAYSLSGALGGWWLGPLFGGHKWEDFPMDLAGAAGGVTAMYLFWRIGRRRPVERAVGLCT